MMAVESSDLFDQITVQLSSHATAAQFKEQLTLWATAFKYSLSRDYYPSVDPLYSELRFNVFYPCTC
jgi:hypothetical protein